MYIFDTELTWTSSFRPSFIQPAVIQLFYIAHFLAIKFCSRNRFPPSHGDRDQMSGADTKFWSEDAYWEFQVNGRNYREDPTHTLTKETPNSLPDRGAKGLESSQIQDRRECFNKKTIALPSWHCQIHTEILLTVALWDVQ